MLEGYLTTKEAAGRLGVSHGRVKQLVASGALPSELVLGRRVIKEADVCAYHPARPGWPKGKSRGQRGGSETSGGAASARSAGSE